MEKNNYVSDLDNKDTFVDNIKRDIQQRAFAELDNMKKEMANDFLKSSGE